MVKVKDNTLWSTEEGHIDLEQWLHQLGNKGYFQDLELIRHACHLSELACQEHATETGISCLQQGLAMADILADLDVDEETLAAAIIFVSVHFAELSLEDVEEQLGKNVTKLVKGVEKMSAIYQMKPDKFIQNKHQIDNVRKMLLAMVDDVRVVLIKLAERLCVIRSSSNLSEPMRQQIASEIMDIYAPLANRLGIGAIKWEMEDLAFRFLHPDDYKAIAKGLKSKRLERDKYVKWIVDELTEQIGKTGEKHFSVYGRAKHIHSIYKKMSRKNVALDEIYDAIAVRVLVDTVDACYTVLSIVHTLWEQIPSEFDDYIIHMKPNGYQSLHTAVKGTGGFVFEVQIRTFAMHAQAEMGVAAHWKYKEGVGSIKQSYERKIEWLRDILAWHKEIATSSGVPETTEMAFLEDRVYVFTPDGDVLDLPHGVTPLDFAYHVHSELGHRCRGAKVNGMMVPLTTELKTGDRVEILTGKEPKPSRDWMNPLMRYLKTPRARAKVLHWFKMQDYDKNKQAGQLILEKEFKTLGIKAERLLEVTAALNFKTADDLFAAFGRGDVKLAQILHKLSPLNALELPHQLLNKTKKVPLIKKNDVSIEGVGNLLTVMARCCQPLPGQPIVGYITIGRGISIHRQDCTNIIHASERQKQRFLQVSWADVKQEHYVVDLYINAFNRSGLLKDITAELSFEKAQVYSLKTESNTDDNMMMIYLSIETDGLTGLSRLLNKLRQIPNVIEARRQL